MLPAKVISFNRATNRAKVQPLIMMVDTNFEQIERAPISSIPVRFPGAGGYILSFNLKPNDLGWIQANDRDISLFLQNYTNSKPNTFRVKDFADAVFIPDPMTGFTISGEDAENAVLQSLDGTVKISLGTNEITVAAPTVTINADTKAIINGEFEVSGTNLSTLGAAGLAIARVGDPVSVNPTTGIGTITSGGLNKSI